MRKIWVQIDPWNKELATTAIESGADGILLPNDSAEKVRALGKITTIAADGIWFWEKMWSFSPSPGMWMNRSFYA